MPSGYLALDFPLLWIPALLVIGLVIGSWLGVLIRRLPEGRAVVFARSACEGCGRPLRPIDLIPVVSYLRLHGRCRDCKGPIARFHLEVELAAAAVALWAALGVGDDISRLSATCVLGWTLLAASWIDMRSMLLPDVLTLSLLLMGLGATWRLEPEAVADHAMAAVVAYLLFRAIAYAYVRLRGRDGLGAGDAKLLAAGASWVGLAALPNLVLVSALLGCASALALRLLGRRLTGTTRIPFGPSLALAIWLIWLYGS